MTMTLNTGHALYGNVKMLICVDESNNLTDLVTPGRTYTKHASAVYGSGTLGRHAGVRRSSYTTYGWTFDTAFTPTNNTGTLVLVVNNVAYAEGSSPALAAFIGSGSSSNSTRLMPTIGKHTGTKYSAAGYYAPGGSMDISADGSTSTIVSTSARMLSLTRNGETAYSLAVNGTEEASGTRLGSNGSTGSYSYIGGVTGNAAMDFDLVYAVWFDVVLTPTELSDLYATLGASNAFGLVTITSGATATTLSGPASGTTGVASTNFTVGANGAITGTVTVTPGDAANGGTFTPTSVAISSGTPTATFTYTPASTGTKTISISDDGGLTDATSLSYAAVSGYAPPSFTPRNQSGINFFGSRK